MARMVLFMWACLTLVVSMPAQGMTWYVDGSVANSGDGTSPETAFKKIQEGIDAASDGDTVSVEKGVYVENIQFKGMNITLTSTDPTDPDVVANTMIDGNRAGSVVTFDGTEDESCLLSGFTIRNGRAEYGGGVAGNDTHAAIQSNTITANSANMYGGGLSECNGIIRNNAISGNSARGGGGLYDCAGTIEENTIGENSATESSGTVGGGGLYQCDGIIRGNRISGNSAAQYGGGLYGCRSAVQNNLIAGNWAARNGGGLFGCHGVIHNNLVTGNSAGQAGGGLCSCHGAVQNNTIAANEAGTGGGLCACRGVVQNNTIAANKAETGGGLYDCGAAIRNCVMWQNTGGKYPQLQNCNEPSYCCIQGWIGGGEQNIADDPKFVDANNGDYHLQAESPCIDRGINYYWFAWPQQELDGNCRLVGERVDMGCYEYGSSSDSDGDLLSDDEEEALETHLDLPDSDDDGLRDGLEILRGTDPLDGSDPSPAVVRVPSDTPVIQKALCLAVNGDEIILEPGTYRENLAFCGANVVVRGSEPETRDVVASTIIDGASRGSVICLTGTESEECVIAGLTIRNGRTGSGGGIWSGSFLGPEHTHATIRMNTITGNSALGSGGGLSFCDGTIENNLITGNSALWDGGGLWACHGVVRGNVLAGNSAGRYGAGCGACDGTVENNVISGNSAESAGGLAFCQGTIRGNAIIGNSAERRGGGMHSCSGIVGSNTVCANTAGESGGGLLECRGSTILNCIIWANTAPQGPQLYESSAPISSWVGGADSGFVDADGPDNNPSTWEDNDYHLASGSPCIDKGKNEDWMWDAVDLDGNERIIDGDEDGLDVVDIGAYEYRFVLRVVGVAAAGGGIQLKWSSQPGQSYIVWTCPDMAIGEWTSVATVASEGATTTWTFAETPSRRMLFLRISLD